MFARMVAIALLVAGIGSTPLALAAAAQPAPVPRPAAAQTTQPTQPAQAVPAQQQATPGTQQDATDDEEAPPPSSQGDNSQPIPSGPLTSTDKIVKSFMQLDTDKSNSVSFDEYMTMVNQRAKDRFNAMDANHDGQVTADEYRQFWLHRMAHWYRLRR